MTEQEQQIALCEWAGWKWQNTYITAYGAEQPIKQWCLNGKPYNQLPDTNSLDVLHSFEMKLTWTQRTHYAHNLSRLLLISKKVEYPKGQPADLVEDFTVLSATVEHRRIALLKTLNLWREDSK